MKIAERDACHLIMKDLIVVVRDSKVIHGGDLCLFPSAWVQQAILPKTTIISDRNVSWSLIISSSSLKGVIFVVPFSNYEEDILVVLIDQIVVSVKRLPFKGQPDTPSETILLSSRSLILNRVNIAAMSYRIHQPIPIPLSGNKCWWLGHLTSRCSSLFISCKKCGKPHPIDAICSKKCIKCNSTSHDRIANYALNIKT